MGDKFTVSGETVSMLFPFYGVSNPSEDVCFPYQVVRQTTLGITPTGGFLFWGPDDLLWGVGNQLEWGTGTVTIVLNWGTDVLLWGAGNELDWGTSAFTTVSWGIDVLEWGVGNELGWG